MTNTPPTGKPLSGLTSAISKALEAPYFSGTPSDPRLLFDAIRVTLNGGHVFIDLIHHGEEMWRFDSGRVINDGDTVTVSGVRGELPITLS